MSIIKTLQKKFKRTLFTTPSHGQKNLFFPIKNLYEKDFSEIDGFDNILKPTGQIFKSQLKASQIYGSKQTFYLTNGSTIGILAAMKALISEKDKVVVARNCHACVFSGLVLTGAQPIWIEPTKNEEWGVYGAIDPLDIEEHLKKKDIKAVIITSPTYEGIVCDIEAIAMLCEKYEAYLIVDEAHGALFNFSKDLPTPAIRLGASISVNSLHKTAGALNPAALLHIGRDSNIDPEKIQNSLNLFQTSSPSYPLLANIEATIDFLNYKGNAYIEKLLNQIEKFKSAARMKNWDFFNNDDLTKIVIKGGYELSSALSKNFDIEDECSNSKSTLFLTGIGTDEKKIKTLVKALNKLNSQDFKGGENFFPPKPEMKYLPKIAYNSNYVYLDALDATGFTCAQIISPYPPGIGILYPGEVIKEEHAPFLNGYIKVMKG